MATSASITARVTARKRGRDDTPIFARMAIDFAPIDEVWMVGDELGTLVRLGVLGLAPPVA